MSDKTSAGLRDVLFDELTALRSGEITASRANAVVRIAESIIGSVHLEIEVARLAALQGSSSVTIHELTAPVQLGSK